MLRELFLSSYCPNCDLMMVRSRSRTTFEKVVAGTTPFSPYRCEVCQWRGWRVSTRKMPRWRLALLILLILVLLASAIFMLSRFSEELSPPDSPKRSAAQTWSRMGESGSSFTPLSRPG